MEADAMLLTDLVYLNYRYSNGKYNIYKTLHNTVNYSKEEEKKMLNAFIHLRVDYGLELKSY